MVAKRFDIWTVPLDPSFGSEFQKTRPCIIVSPDEANHHLNTVVVVPMTSSRHQYRARTNLTFDSQAGQAATDQVRVVDKQRLMSQIGQLDLVTGAEILRGLREFFSLN